MVTLRKGLGPRCSRLPIVPMHQENGWPTLTDWVEPRRNDVVKFDNLTPSDLILEWDYQEVVSRSRFRWESSHTITVEIQYFVSGNQNHYFQEHVIFR